jgi:pantetheine-phosphate adenylyltransferase
MKKAVFPGSFDPYTRGHDALVRRAIDLFDEIIIAIGTNTSKSYLFDLDTRTAQVSSLYQNEAKVSVQQFNGLTIDFCKAEGAQYILRGLRDGKDFDYENAIAIMNQRLAPQVETIFLLTEPEYAGISSTILREILRNGGDISPFVPEGMKID